MTIEELHQKILYPIARVSIPGRGGGSGSVIYSEPSEDNKEEYDTFVITNHHVVADAISRKKDWESMLGQEIEKDFYQKVDVEIFDYVYQSTVSSSNSYKADVVAYDQNHDLAVLKLNSPNKINHVAALISRDKIKDLRLFTPIIGCGCSLLHDPFQTRGELTSLNEIIENRQYYMTSQNSIFGNSGGAIYLAETGEQIGVTARITNIQLGFGIDVMTWMGFCVTANRIYEFFDEQELKFMYDPKDTYNKAMKRRESRRKARMMEIRRGSGGKGKNDSMEDEDDKWL